jgi:hypothetical protein
MQVADGFAAVSLTNGFTQDDPCGMVRGLLERIGTRTR